MKTNPNILILLALLAVSAVQANTLTVVSTADSGPGTLRLALANAADGDTIDASRISGTILLTSGELLVDKSVSIVGPGPTNLAIDGNAANRVLHIGSNTVVAILGLTVTEGNVSLFSSSPLGGGIYNDHATLTVSNCVVAGNSGGSGGAIANDGSSGSAALTVVNSTLSGNSAGFGGGGIYNAGHLGSATLTLSNCSIRSNLAAVGGGLYNASVVGSAPLMVISSSISGNAATNGSGGGLFSLFNSSTNAPLVVINSVINGNTATNGPGGGGGVFNDVISGGATLTFVSSSISSNLAAAGGGVDNIAATESAAVALMASNCVISGNSAISREINGTGTGGEGGGIVNDSEQGSAALTLLDSTVSGNSAQSALINGVFVAERGGGIENLGVGGSATLTISNCILSGNSAPFAAGGGLYNLGVSSLGTGSVWIANSTLSANSAGFGGGFYNDAEQGSATLQLTSSTLVGNSAENLGGGIYNFSAGSSSAEIAITDSTFSGNSAGQLAGGGGIYNYSILQGTGNVWIANSTLSGNFAPGGAGGIHNIAGPDSNATVLIGSTILNGDASGLNISNDLGTVASLGFNLSSDDGGGLLNQLSDIINTDPMLGPLQDNGGPTFTHALLPGSPAIDHGKNISGSLYDQRGPGFVRTYDDPSIPNAPDSDGTDIGAFEVRQSHATPEQGVQHLLDLVNSQWARPQPLDATLDAALASIKRDNPSAAANQLQAFQNKVRAQVMPTNPGLAGTLIEIAGEVIGAMTKP